MEPYDPRRIGKPLGIDKPDSAFNECRRLIKQGKRVIVLTARLNSKTHTPAQLKYTRKLIRTWTEKYLGKPLSSTSEKHHLITKIYDDRNVVVDPKTGLIK
jgi:ubiquinone/menaquinone biosynthesis C-methylase UbiE